MFSKGQSILLQSLRIFKYRTIHQSHFRPSIQGKYSSCLSTSALQCQNKSADLSEYNNVEFKKIYRFPYIQSVRLLARLKLYQTGATSALIPVYSVLYYMDRVTSGDVMVAFSVAGFAGVMLYVMSGYFNNIIGIISISKDETLLRVGHLTFWGGRKNVFVSVDQVVPLSDLPDANKLNDVYIKFKRYDSDQELLLSLRYGGIDDINKFNKVFEPHQSLEQ